MNFRAFSTVAFALAFVAFAAAGSAVALAQGKGAKEATKGAGASDTLIATFASTAFRSLPEVVKNAEGEEVKIDKTKVDEIVVPDEQLQEVILVASQVSGAANCKLEELANAYWITYRRSLKTSGKWTQQQRVFMAQVFNVAVRFASATEAKATEGEKETVLKKFKAKECTDAKREALKAQILANIKVLQKT